MVTLEVCSNSVQSSIEAQKGGASRVELCANLVEGGTTPPQSMIELTRQNINIQLNVIIRPRGGDFLYTELEFESMKRDVQLCGSLGCDGVVIGFLNSDGTVDKCRTKVLVALAHNLNMTVTFHRAFDRCINLLDALEDVIDCKCDRILTSGGCCTALEGKDTIKELINTSRDRIKIMPGSGITEYNIVELVRATGLQEFHGSFRSSYRGRMEYLSPFFSKDMNSEYNFMQTDLAKVQLAIKNANGLN